jgi:hypothetical protein
MSLIMLKTYKENGTTQRKDITLSLGVANAIRNHIISGGKLFDKKGFITLSVKVENQNKPYKIKTGTLNSWISRGNVIPETGEELKQFIDKAREDYRIKMKEQRKDKIVELAERKISRTLNLRTNKPVRDRNGKKIIDEDTGEYIRKEDTKLLNTQMQVAKYALDRLDKVNYGKQAEKEKTVVFDLASLRRAKEQLENSQ